VAPLSGLPAQGLGLSLNRRIVSWVPLSKVRYVPGLLLAEILYTASSTRGFANASCVEVVSDRIPYVSGVKKESGLEQDLQ
jgi:hypothetical protein